MKWENRRYQLIEDTLSGGKVFYILDTEKDESIKIN